MEGAGGAEEEDGELGPHVGVGGCGLGRSNAFTAEYTDQWIE